MTDELDALEKRAQIKSSMLKMCEPIEFGSDAAIIDELLDALASLRRQLAENEVEIANAKTGWTMARDEIGRSRADRDYYADLADSLQSQLTAEREKVENLHANLRLEREQHAETDRAYSASMEAWETDRHALTTERERVEALAKEVAEWRSRPDALRADKAEAEAREMRELLKEARGYVNAYRDSDPHGARHMLARIDAKLTKGA